MKNHRDLRAFERDFLLQFYRNGRWGTCVDCPRDTNGRAYPEFCEYTERYDHKLTLDDLVGHYEVILKS
jgi:hypothetical protein